MDENFDISQLHFKIKLKTITIAVSFFLIINCLIYDEKTIIESFIYLNFKHLKSFRLFRLFFFSTCKAYKLNHDRVKPE